MRIALLLALVSTLNAAPFQWEQGVIVQKIGKAEMFIFASGAEMKKLGEIKVGNTIVVKYGIRLTKDKARFIAMDSAKVKGKLNPNLKTGGEYVPGFLVTDIRNPQLNITINQGMLAKVRGVVQKGNATQEKISRSANLNVEFETKNGHVVISRVTID